MVTLTKTLTFSYSILVVIISISQLSARECDFKNPAYASILAYDVAKMPSEIEYSKKPFITYNDGEIFYFDKVANPCYFKFVQELNYIDPRVTLYSFYSDFNTYRKSFASSSLEENEADGFVISIRGTKNPMDVVNDIQLLFNSIPNYFYDIRDILDPDSLHERGLNRKFLNKLKYFTGHSLGGSLAELLAIYFDKYSISYDPLGTKKFLTTINNEFNMSQASIDKIVKNKFTSYISMPNIINTVFEYSTSKSQVVFTIPDPNCENYFYRKFDFFDFRMKYIPNKLIDMASTLTWTLYYHTMENIRNTILLNFKKTGFESISEYEKDKTKLAYYNDDSKINNFFAKFYNCLKGSTGNKSYFDFKAEIIKQFLEDLDNLPDDDDIIPLLMESKDGKGSGKKNEYLRNDKLQFLKYKMKFDRLPPSYLK